MNLEDFYFCNKLVLFYQSQDDFTFRKVASTTYNARYELENQLFVKRSHNLSVENPLHKQFEKAKLLFSK